MVAGITATSDGFSLVLLKLRGPILSRRNTTRPRFAFCAGVQNHVANRWQVPRGGDGCACNRLAIVSGGCTDKPAADSAHFESYAKPDGASYFALSLMPQTALPPAENCDLVVLVDTSASQVGAYREKSLETLRGMLATLGDKDRVKLMAVDVNAVPMTSDFVAPNGPEMKAALQKLQNRVPLGATDLEAALNAAIKSIPAESTTQHAAIYFALAAATRT